MADDGALIGEGPRLPAGRAFHAGGIVNGRVMIVGGSSWNGERTVKRFHDDTLIFDGGEWKAGPVLVQRFVEGAYGDDGVGLYIAGGLIGQDEATDQVYGIARKGEAFEVARLASLPAAVTACSGAVAGGRFYVACGSRGGKFVNEMWSLDISRGDSSWREEAAIPGPGRGYAGLARCGDQLFLMGGLGSLDGIAKAQALDDVYRFDLGTRRWEKVGNLTMAGYCWSAVGVGSDLAMVTGRADGGIYPEVWLVDLKKMSAHVLGKCAIQATGAPLLRVKADTWWQIGGEPDSKRSRTELVTSISFKV